MIYSLQFCKFFLSELLFLVKLQEIISKRLLLLSEPNFGCDDGFALYDGADLYFARQFFDFGIFGSDVSLIDISLELQEYQLVLYVFCGLIGYELVGW